MTAMPRLSLSKQVSSSHIIFVGCSQQSGIQGLTILLVSFCRCSRKAKPGPDVWERDQDDVAFYLVHTQDHVERTT